MTCEIITLPETERVRCDRRAEVTLTVSRPCGFAWQVRTCPGHAEAVVGVNDATPCGHCGRTNETTVLPV